MYVIRRPIVRNSRESLIITFLASSLYNIIRAKMNYSLNCYLSRLFFQILTFPMNGCLD